MDDPTDEYPLTPDPNDDPDRLEQGEAIRFIARRALLWFVPLVGVGVLLSLLGLPTWVVIVVVVAALIFVVLELDI